MDSYDVVVKGFPSTMNQIKIKLFLQKEIKCKVKEVKRISDRTVGIVFEDADGLKSFVECNIKSVMFGNDSYELQYLKIPSNAHIDDETKSEADGPMQLLSTHYKRKFVIKGVGENTSEDDLIMCLESCLENETSPISCIEQSFPGIYLVEYDAEFELAETNSFLEKASSKSLGGKTLQASKLPRSCCLLVNNIPKEASNEKIKLTFESRRRANGGPVEQVDRLKETSALVYFENFEDTERIYDKFKKSQHSNEAIKIDCSEVSIELYHHLLRKEHIKETQEKARGDLSSKVVEFKASCSKKVLIFLKENKKHYQKLLDSFKDVARIELCDEPKDSQLVKCFLLEGVNEEKCRMVFASFIDRYLLKSKSFKKKTFDKAKLLQLHPLLKNSAKEVVNEDITIKWKDNTVTMTGLKGIVQNTMREIQNAVEFQTIEITKGKEDFWIMRHCGIIENLQQEYENVAFKCDEDKNIITVTGAEDDNCRIHRKALSLKNAVKQRKIVGLDESVIQYLNENAASIRSKIQNLFTVENIKAMVGCNAEELTVLSLNEEEHKKALDLISTKIAVEIIPVSEKKADVIGTESWKQFREEIQRERKYGLYLKANHGITMVGFKSDMTSLKSRIDAFLNENEIVNVTISMSYGKASYILERSTEFGQDNRCRKSLVKCVITTEQGEGIHLEGIQKNVHAAEQEIKKILNSVIEEKHTRQEPGIKSYYVNGIGKKELGKISRHSKCVILAGSAQNPKSNRSKMEAASRTSSAAGRQREVTFTVQKIDITQHCCDVIINPTNTDLKLFPGGVSGYIKQHDDANASKIQKEMKQIVGKCKGKISPGDAFITGAGNLPKCKKIIHAVGPRWTNEETMKNQSVAMLISCVTKSLEEMEGAKLGHVSIPAISCGDFGGKADICIPVIVTAVSKYLRRNPSSSITQVDFVEIECDEVLNEFRKAVSEITRSNTMKPDFPPKPTPRKIAPTSQNSVGVTLVNGDIAKQNVDAVVNILAEHHVKDLTQGSVIAKVISSNAGSDVVSECAKHAGKYKVGSVFETIAGKLNCKKIFHGLIETCGQNSEEHIKNIVRQCLQMAVKSNLQSIAFPAIGTGGFQHSPQKVANWMKQAIKMYAANLHVSIVLHPSNPTVASVFHAEFNGTSNQSSAVPSSVSYGPLTVSVIQGDITQQTTDVIVNSAHSSFDLKQGGMTSSAIQKQGGPAIQNELQNASGDIAVTSGGNLPCKRIIHMVATRNEKSLQKLIVEVIKKADDLKQSSIAFPALATGNMHMSASSVGSVFRSAIQIFIQLHPKPQTLKKVDVVIFDMKLLKDFKDAIVGSIVPDKSTLQRKMKYFSGSFIRTSPIGVPQEILELYFYATHTGAIKKALKAIDSHTTNVIAKEEIANEALASVAAREEFEIGQIEKANNVKIEMQYDKYQYLKCILVCGLAENVRKATVSITAILREINDAKTSAQFIIWEKRGFNESWVKFPARVSHVLEKEYRQQKNKKLGPIQIQDFQFNMIVTQTFDLSTLEKDGSNIRRRPNETATLPVTWANMDGCDLKRVVLKQGSVEYKKVLLHLHDTGTKPTIVTIERIQSIALHKQYVAKKAEVTNKLKGTKYTVERQLFHGTTNADKIINNGFDRSFAGLNAAAFGNGVYFATQSSYSHNYASPGENNIRTMFLADVITGVYAKGSPGIKTPPVRSGNDLHDSVVNRMDAPSIYVIFKDASAYPTYLIKYT